MEVAALCSLLPLPAASAAAAIASFAPLHLRPISFNPPSVTSFVTSLPLSSLHSWAVLSLLASVRTPILRSLGEISHCSPLALALPRSFVRPIVLSSIWDLLTCAYHQYMSAVRASVSAMPLEPPPCYWGNKCSTHSLWTGRVGCDVRSARSACTKRAGGFLCQIPLRRSSLYSSLQLPVCLPSSLISIIRSFSQSNHRILYLLFISIADLPSSIHPPSLAHCRQAGGRAGEQA